MSRTVSYRGHSYTIDTCDDGHPCDHCIFSKHAVADCICLETGIYDTEFVSKEFNDRPSVKTILYILQQYAGAAPTLEDAERIFNDWDENINL